jgi:hypothetical protein
MLPQWKLSPLIVVLSFAVAPTVSASSLVTGRAARPVVPTVQSPPQPKTPETDLELQDEGNNERSAHNYSKAIDSYTRALVRAQNKPLSERASIYFDRGIAYDLSNHSFDATRDFKEALKMYETYVHVNPTADDMGVVSFAINNLNAQISLRDKSELDEETYLRNVTNRRWPDRRFPLRIHIDSSTTHGFDLRLQRLIRNAIDEWATVPGANFRWVPVPDERGADIVVTRAVLENELIDNAGQTSFEYKDVDGNTSEISVVRVKVFCPGYKADELTAASTSQLYTSLLHAFGHAFGVDGHSSSGLDVMYFKSSVGHLSMRDKAGFRQIYQ